MKLGIVRTPNVEKGYYLIHWMKAGAELKLSVLYH